MEEEEMDVEELVVRRNEDDNTTESDEDRFEKDGVLDKSTDCLDEPKHSVPGWRRKHVYLKQNMSTETEDRSIWIKVPNIREFRRRVLVQKILHMNYIAEHTKPIRHKFRTRGFQWYRDLQKRLETVDAAKRRFKQIKQPPRAKADTQISTNTYPEAICFPLETDFTDDGNEDETLLNPLESPYEAAYQKEKFRQFELRNIPDDDTCPNDDPISQEELLNILDTEVISDETFEIIANFRRNDFRSRKRDTKSMLYRSATSILRQGLISHDWAVAAKGCEILSKELTRHTCRVAQGHSIWNIWNGGFLALTNIYRNNNCIRLVLDTAKQVQSLLTSYPRRIGIDVATWLTQIGEFSTGLKYLEDLHDMYLQSKAWKTQKQLGYVRRKQVDLVAELFTAAKQYAIFRLNKRYCEEYNPLGHSQLMYEAAEFSLDLFQILEERFKTCKQNPTIFLKQFIELLLEVRGKDAAEKKFDAIYCSNEDDGVIASMYKKFIEEHCPHAVEKRNELEMKLSEYNYAVPDLTKEIRDEKFNIYVQSLPKVSSFKVLEKPAFCW